jgi:hypothetical protein
MRTTFFPFTIIGLCIVEECDVEECDVDDSLADARKDIKHGQVVVKDETSGGDKM